MIRSEDLAKLHKRFWVKVKLEDTCWVWAGAKNMQGYGVLKLPKLKKVVRAHRLSYFLEYGIDPGEKLVCHHCDNRLCVRPSHLFLGTIQDNNTDMYLKGRGSKGNRKGTLNPACKLTEHEVIEIRELVQQKVTCAEIGRRYKISRSTVSGIKRGSLWASL